MLKQTTILCIVFSSLLLLRYVERDIITFAVSSTDSTFEPTRVDQSSFYFSQRLRVVGQDLGDGSTLNWSVQDVFAYPHAMLLGNQRSGTSLLFRTLCRSPSIACNNGVDPKETHFWSRDVNDPAFHGCDNYTSLAACYLREVLEYEQVVKANFSVASIDFTATYLRGHNVTLPHIASHFPWILTFAVLREPIGAMLSNAVHMRFKYNVTSDFTTEFTKRHHYTYGLWAQHAAATFEQRKLLWMQYEQLRRWPLHVFTELLRFLRVAPPWHTQQFLQHHDRFLASRYVSCDQYEQAVQFFKAEERKVNEIFRRVKKSVPWSCMWESVLRRGRAREREYDVAPGAAKAVTLCHPEDYDEQCIEPPPLASRNTVRRTSGFTFNRSEALLLFPSPAA